MEHRVLYALTFDTQVWEVLKDYIKDSSLPMGIKYTVASTNHYTANNLNKQTINFKTNILNTSHRFRDKLPKFTKEKNYPHTKCYFHDKDSLKI